MLIVSSGDNKAAMHGAFYSASGTMLGFTMHCLLVPDNQTTV